MENKLAYLKSYSLNWETFDVVSGGKSSLDARNYLTELYNIEQVHRFLHGYGFDISDPVENAELFGIFQEALQFIRRYFLKEGNSDGLDLKIPSFLYSVTDISEVFLAATAKTTSKISMEDQLWAGIILKVMHTILHADKDLRYRYFSQVQQQVFDRFYKFINRDESDQLYLKDESGLTIPLQDFQTKSKKSRDSIIIKLLHKQENVAEELFDRIGIRFVTYNKLDSLRVVKFLVNNYVVIINNIKPSRSHNSLVDLKLLRKKNYSLLKTAIKEGWNEEQFYQKMNQLIEDCVPSFENQKGNPHSLNEYKAIHFTARQLIKYKNPFVGEFNEVRKVAIKNKENPLSEKLLQLDTSPISRDVRFFYPYEIQITDYESHLKNTQGEASHVEYKKIQLKSAMKRIFKPLLDLREIKNI